MRYSGAKRFLLSGIAMVLWLGMAAVDASEPDPALVRLVEETAPNASMVRHSFTINDTALECLVYGTPDTGALGFAFRTAQLAPGVEGFGGPLDLAVAVTEDGVLQGIDWVESRETPSYEEQVRAWLPTLVGRRIFEAPDVGDVDAVTGATFSSEAIIEMLSIAGSAFAETVLGSEEIEKVRRRRQSGALPSVVLLGAAFVAGVLRQRPSRRVRQIWLAAVVLGFGVVWNLQFSMASVLRWFRLDWPVPAWSLSFALVAGIPIGVWLVGNLYCGWLCPFGALQELVGDWRRGRWGIDPERPAWARIRRAKYAVLALGIGLAFRGYADRVAAGDPLAFAFGPDRSAPMFYGAVLLTAAAVVFGRFWCRNLCPAGAALSVLGRLSPFRHFWPRIRPGHCDLGVSSRKTWDCLLCDRCRQPGSSHAVSSIPPRARSVLLGVAVGLALAGCMFFLATT